MSEAADTTPLAGLDPDALRGWVEQQRWYASKSRSVTHVDLLETAQLGAHPPLLVLALMQTGFATGTHELYQLPLGLRPVDDKPADTEVIAEHEGYAIYDALADPELGRALLDAIDETSEVSTEDGRFSFHRANGKLDLGDAPVRPMGVEQSNTSLVFGDALVAKVFRKLEPGLNPELELLRFLTAAGFENIAPLYGWAEYEGRSMSATLAVVQRYFPDSAGGWELALDELQTNPDTFLERLATLGEVTARMHNTLASDATDPAFAPEEPSQESLALLTATVDEDIERIFSRLPDDNEAIAPIAGTGQDVQEHLSMLAGVGTGGRLIRTHGDYHLGQTLNTPRGWVILDFEGEPARSLPERRQKRSPLRDVAGMLRSFAYVASAADIQRGTPAPDDWEERARETFLSNYLEHVEPALMPPGEQAVHKLLSVFELEKAVYELRYELDNRPDWVSIPVAGIRRLLDDGT
jgi:maltokinase